MPHPPLSTLERFARGSLPDGEHRSVVEHLHRGCPRCLACLHVAADRLDAEHPPAELEPGPELPASAGNHLRALARALKSIPCWQKEERVRDRYRERQATEREVRQMLAERHPVAACEALMELAFAERYRNPGKMLDLAQRAVDAVLGADGKSLGLGYAAMKDLYARAWAELGNAQRVSLDFRRAAESLEKAWAAWQAGSRDPLLEARLADLEASFASSRRELPVALQWLRQALVLYESLGETHLAGRTLISLGINTVYDGQEAEAVELFRQGLAIIDRSRDPQLYWLAQKNLLNALVECGQYREAARHLFESGLRQALAGDRPATARLGWIEGKILAGLGKPRQAIRELERAREAFEERQEVGEAALLGLELAGVWLELHQWGAVKALAREARDTLVRLGIPAEASKAVTLLDLACQEETATAGFLRRVLRFLRLAQWHPEQRFA